VLCNDVTVVWWGERYKIQVNLTLVWIDVCVYSCIFTITMSVCNIKITMNVTKLKPLSVKFVYLYASIVNDLRWKGLVHKFSRKRLIEHALVAFFCKLSNLTLHFITLCPWIKQAELQAPSEKQDFLIHRHILCTCILGTYSFLSVYTCSTVFL